MGEHPAISAHDADPTAPYHHPIGISGDDARYTLAGRKIIILMLSFLLQDVQSCSLETCGLRFATKAWSSVASHGSLCAMRCRLGGERWTQSYVLPHGPLTHPGGIGVEKLGQIAFVGKWPGRGPRREDFTGRKGVQGQSMGSRWAVAEYRGDWRLSCICGTLSLSSSMNWILVLARFEEMAHGAVASEETLQGLCGVPQMRSFNTPWAEPATWISTYADCVLRFSVFKNFESTHRFNSVEFTNQCVGHPCPLMLITGFRPQLIRFCAMHAVHLGICQWVNGSAVWDLADHGFFGNGGIQDKLDELCRRFNLWCSMSRIRHYQPYIPYAVLAVKPGEYPELRLKAWTSRVLTSFLSVAMQELVQSFPPEARPASLVLAAVAIHKLGKWMLHVERCGKILTEGEAVEMHKLAWEFLDTYQALAANRLSAGVLRYPIKPKHHAPWL